MGELRDMGNPAQVVKKNPAQAAKPRVLPRVQDFFYHVYYEGMIQLKTIPS
jgi:hypothetical protein